jgi:hypothetical protein
MFGSAPSLPVGLEPLVVAEQILVAIESDVPSLHQFTA